MKFYQMMRKRVLAMMATVVLSVGLLAGCQQPTEPVGNSGDGSTSPTSTTRTDEADPPTTLTTAPPTDPTMASATDPTTAPTAAPPTDPTTAPATDPTTAPTTAPTAAPTDPPTSPSTAEPTRPTAPEEQVEVSLAYIFADHMVLQREKPVKIWGTCTGADTVEVSFQNQRKTGQVTDGAFAVYLDAMEANATGSELTVTAGNASYTITDVLVGDVWLCSGQSNMEMTVGACNTAQRAQIQEWAGNSQIRLTKIPQYSSRVELSEFDERVVWTDSDYAKLLSNSAYAFVFGARLQRELEVPIGIVNSSFGGTDLEQWVSLDTLNSLGIRYGSPGAKYNYMISPMKGLTIKGILWYQGENNVNRTTSYTDLFNAYAAQYREEFEDPDLPIITTMLDRYYDPAQLRWGPFRLEQWAIAQGDPHMEIVCSIDLGDKTNIHPNDKCELGVRAAELALNKVYGITSLPGQSAYPSSMRRSGDTLRIRFQDAESGLRLSSGSTVASLVVVDAAGNSHTVEGTLSGDELVVPLSGIDTPAYVRYAYDMYPETINFYTGNGLPVAPFELAVA